MRARRQRTANTQYPSRKVAALAGEAAAARAHWEKAAAGRDSFFRALPYAHLAAQRLGGGEEAAGRAKLEAALAESARFLEGGTGFPGVVAYAQGMILRALGREDEARERFSRALLLPDQQLSHFLSRRALEGARPF